MTNTDTDNGGPAFQTCSQNGCEQPAAVKYHWLSEPMLACIDHAAWVGQVGNAMGMHIHFEPIDPTDPNLKTRGDRS